jgi:hypothetical protein
VAAGAAGIALPEPGQLSSSASRKAMGNKKPLGDQCEVPAKSYGPVSDAPESANLRQAQRSEIAFFFNTDYAD